MPYAHVKQDILAHLPVADLNALLVLIVPMIKLVLTRNAKILAQVLVVLVLVAKSSTTIQYAAVRLSLLVIHLCNVAKKVGNNYLLNVYFITRVLSSIEVEPRPAPVSLCIPSPCGPNADCRVVDSRPVCSCLAGMLGAPPNCRPECVIHQDCPLHLACFGNKCKDPCVGSCGFNAQCNVQNHRPLCTCLPGFEGDPFSGCNPIQGKCVLFK